MNKKIALPIVLVLIIGSIIWLQTLKPDTGVVVPSADLAVSQETSPEPAPVEITEKPVVKPVPIATKYLTPKQKAAQFESGHELVGITNYLNLPAGQTSIALKDLVGKKVILIDFWTYSCINCQRTLPYVTNWYDKYKDAGLVVIGVHTPEFEFEKDPVNVQAAIARYNIHYPVVLDSNRSTWTAYQNLYWPREYLIDIDGYIVHDHIGEGQYGETEKAIQQALAERASRLNISADVNQPLSKPVADAAPKDVVSPETYFGSARNNYLGNGTPGKSGSQSFALPAFPKQNVLYLGGQWNITDEYATSEATNSRIMYGYLAQQVYFVAQAATPIQVTVLRDGKSLTAAEAGEDIVIAADGTSTVTINQARLYKLIKEGVRTAHSLELIPQAPGLQAFTFTFG